jgi:hypothetical protein
MRITHNKIPDDCRIEEAFKINCDSMPEYLSYARRTPDSLPTIISAALDLACFGMLVDPRSPEVPRALRLAAQASAALFAAASAHTKPVVIRLGVGEPVKYQSLVDESILTAGRWLAGFFLSLLCRDSGSLDMLCDAPTELVRRCSTTFPEYKYMLVDALKSFWRPDGDSGDRLVEVIEATDPELFGDHSDRAFVRYAEAIDVPLIRLVLLCHEKEGDFSKTLAMALKQHKKYWSGKNSNNREGFVALNLTGISALAHDRGLPVDVESDYLPADWVTGKVFTSAQEPAREDQAPQTS